MTESMSGTALPCSASSCSRNALSSGHSAAPLLAVAAGEGALCGMAAAERGRGAAAAPSAEGRGGRVGGAPLSSTCWFPWLALLPMDGASTGWEAAGVESLSGTYAAQHPKPAPGKLR